MLLWSMVVRPYPAHGEPMSGSSLFVTSDPSPLTLSLSKGFGSLNRRFFKLRISIRRIRG